VKAATLEQSDRIALEGKQRVLANIGASHIMTNTEMQLIFEELGNGIGKTPII
jgi:hypothetical protein